MSNVRRLFHSDVGSALRLFSLVWLSILLQAYVLPYRWFPFDGASCLLIAVLMQEAHLGWSLAYVLCASVLVHCYSIAPFSTYLMYGLWVCILVRLVGKFFVIRGTTAQLILGAVLLGLKYLLAYRHLMVYLKFPDLSFFSFISFAWHHAWGYLLGLIALQFLSKMRLYVRLPAQARNSF